MKTHLILPLFSLVLALPAMATTDAPAAAKAPNPKPVAKKDCPADPSITGRVNAVFTLDKKLKLSVQGPVDANMLKAFQEAFAKTPAEVREVQMDFNSPGGDVMVGFKVIEEIREQKRLGRQFTSTVRNGLSCQSMCVPLYVQGDVRKAGPSASFMFHSAHFRVFGVIGFTGKALNNDKIFEIFKAAGVSEAWLASLIEQKVFETPRPYWASGRELMEESSNIVTELLPRHDPSNSFEIGGKKFWL